MSYLLTRNGKSWRLLAANLQGTPLRVRVPGLVGGTMEVYRGQTPDAQPADTIVQPCGVSARKFDGMKAPYSLCLIPLTPATR